MAYVMSLKDAINYGLEHLTQEQLGRVLGVTKDQVYKYASGYTKICSDRVVDAIYDNLDVNDEPVLLDYFESEEKYLKFRKLRNDT